MGGGEGGRGLRNAKKLRILNARRNVRMREYFRIYSSNNVLCKSRKSHRAKYLFLRDIYICVSRSLGIDCENSSRCLVGVCRELPRIMKIIYGPVKVAFSQHHTMLVRAAP